MSVTIQTSDQIGNSPDAKSGRVRHCMYDTHAFEGKVFTYPVKELQTGWVVKGCFCSPNCTKSYVLRTHACSMSLLTRMMADVYGIDSSLVVPAPPVELLEKYCLSPGALSIDQLRSMSRLITPMSKPVVTTTTEPLLFCSSPMAPDASTTTSTDDSMLVQFFETKQ